MTFNPKTWLPGKGGNTPITAAELNRLEQGVAEATQALEELGLEDVVTAQVTADGSIILYKNGVAL